jgi:hypothetical protein
MKTVNIQPHIINRKVEVSGRILNHLKGTDWKKVLEGTQRRVSQLIKTENQ